MEIPAHVQARINDIQARFAPPTSATGATQTSTDFADVLANQLLSSGTSAVDGATAATEVLDPSVLSSAGALSSLGVLTGTGTGTSTATRTVRTAAAAYGAVSGVSTAGPIATKRAVANLEGLYDNGRMPDEALTSIGVGSHRLSAPAASAFVKLRAAAKADGVEFGVTDSYRSYDAQVDVARRKGLYSEGGLAAKPGTSDHGLGLAVDLDLDAKALAWMRANAGRFGFVEDTPRETWHWKFDGV